MPLGAFRLNSLGKFTVTAAAEVIRRKLSMVAVGDAQIATVQSQFSGASAQFDGTGDYITVSGQSGNTVKFAAGEAFTIECWIRHNGAQLGEWNFYWGLSDSRASGQRELILGSRVSASTGGVPRMFFATDTTVMIADSGVQMATNTWYHLAVVRTAANYWYVFRNGTIVFEGSTGANQQMGNGNGFKIGALGDGTLPHKGWIDEFRISKTARYTAAFTPTTTPFVNDDNTVFLSHMDGSEGRKFFEDDNGVRAKVGSRSNNSVSIIADQSRFGGTSAYFAGGEQIICPGDFSSTGNFTYECWVRRNTTTTAGGVGLAIMVIGNEATGRQMLSVQNAFFRLDGFSTSGIDILQNSTTYAANTWYHLAVVRNGSTVTLYQNGTSIGSGTYSGTFGNASNLYLGMDFSGNFPLTGSWIDEVRVSNIARYTANFTAPTAPFINDANTLLLLHIDGTVGSFEFLDDNGTGRSQRSIQAVGNAQIDTAQSKFSGSSLLLDGTGDYLTVNFHTNTDFEFTAGEDFTIECFIRVNAYAQFNGLISLGSARSGNEYTLYIEGISGAYYATAATFGGANLSRGTTNLSTGTWHHLAVSRSGTTVRLFVNGTLEDTDTYTFTAGQQSTIKIGSFSDGSLAFNGWIDEVRISNTARYTASFTPTTAPFQNDSNTLLLMHMDSTDATTTFIDDNGKTPS